MKVLMINGSPHKNGSTYTALTIIGEELKKYDTNNVFVIGGASIYKELLPYCNEVLVTKVDAIGGADTFFENLDNNNDFELVFESEPVETNGYTIRFTTYQNKNLKEIK